MLRKSAANNLLGHAFRKRKQWFLRKELAIDMIIRLLQFFYSISLSQVCLLQKPVRHYPPLGFKEKQHGEEMRETCGLVVAWKNGEAV